ncbi:MAG: zinc ribbon domain-containing protein [Defluviitaleaceae bacterium]|nr:zinc ribbon domain-containing protein [Defluviitaleaceae bacterium]
MLNTQRIILLIIAAVGIASLFLPWATITPASVGAGFGGEIGGFIGGALGGALGGAGVNLDVTINAFDFSEATDGGFHGAIGIIIFALAGIIAVAIGDKADKLNLTGKAIIALAGLVAAGLGALTLFNDIFNIADIGSGVFLFLLSGLGLPVVALVGGSSTVQTAYAPPVAPPPQMPQVQMPQMPQATVATKAAFCPSCGVKTEGNAAFCPACGGRF